MNQLNMYLRETWRGLGRKVFGIVLSLLTIGCSHAVPCPLLTRKTTRGEIQYTLHSPETPASQHVILAHGFLRSPQTMDHLAKAFAKNGIETACIQLKRSTPLNGNHAENARDMVALRESLGWKTVTYAGFSAGGLSALIAASSDPACRKLLLLDPVDHASLDKEAAAKIRIPALAFLGKPGLGNRNRNATAMLAVISGCRIIEIPEATHCDFEAHSSTLCHRLTGSRPDAARTSDVHETLLRESSLFLKTH
jgi:predicted alpha/beta-hydrolase family hydrolase